MTPPQMVPRLPNGRVLRTTCDDPNCNGILQAEEQYGMPIWSCDGLTYDHEGGPLRACERTFDRLRFGRSALKNGNYWSLEDEPH